MFTKKDYDNYFDQIARIERKMIYRAFELGRQLEDIPLKRALQKIGDDEVRHYGYVLKMLQAIADIGRQELRCEIRKHSLATIRLRSLQEQDCNEAQAYCINLSKSGMSMECEQDFPLGSLWELTIQIFGKEEPLCCRGKVVWIKEVEPNLYVSGMIFEGLIESVARQT